MLNHKNFIDIQRFQTKYYDCFEKGDIIQISEKLDGSNASIQHDDEEDVLQCFSRKQILSSTNTLNGFYEFVQQLNKDFFKKYKQYRFFGEWNLKHLVKYEEDMVKKFHCFDMYDIANNKWMCQDFVKNACSEGNITLVPEFYYGEFNSWEEIEKYVGKTIFGLKNGEGIVVKNQTKLNNPNSKTPFVVKLVSTEYQETAQRKVKEPISKEQLEILQYKNDLTSTIVTKNRVEKNIYKMIMNGELQEDWDETSMSLIAKQLPRIVYDDCKKEEEETVLKIDDFGKFCAIHTMKIVRNMLNDR